ncbi:unnamed protein product [marine sediment metagenome]|uniref:Uncharacterized protein n=1 Tax=marine sediment metagenome TaxID=412755 RepID=X1FWE8_9ZZZZ
MAERVIGVIEFARDVLGIELSEFQEKVLRQVERGEKLILMRRGKKTTVARVWDEYSRRGIPPIVRARDYKIKGD